MNLDGDSFSSGEVEEEKDDVFAEPDTLRFDVFDDLVLAGLAVKALVALPPTEVIDDERAVRLTLALLGINSTSALA